MAASSGRRSRKRRRSGEGPRAQPEAAADLPERRPRSAREALAPKPQPRRSQLTPAGRAAHEPAQRQRDSMLGTYGERPANPFGGVPVAEIAIIAGAVGLVYGLIAGGTVALTVGAVICTLGVAEFSVREHFSGYRSHTTMLAAIPAIAVGIALISLFGSSLARSVLLAVLVVVFGVCFWLLRKRFRVARQARIAKPPTP